VARDATTGELGVAVQSHWFSVGSRVAWAEAGVGAIATQSFTDPAYGALGLAMMRLGKSAPDALQALVAGDAGRDVRQLGFVDASGRASTYTGAKCIPAAGGRSGDGYAVQANLMEKDTVWPAMAKAYESASGDLAERMLQALEAAEREGGDLRGRQSAALVIVKAKSSGRPWADRVFDLRVDDHAQPLVELRRLVEVQRAYNHMNVGDECAELQDWTCADREYGAAQKLQPANAEISFWAAVGQAMAGRMETATPLFRRAFVADARWRELVKRLPGVGLLPNDPKLLEQILIIK
jgi:uncharacterized Ntn-hydrolase superfamily protein